MSVDGDWNLTMNTPMGAQQSKMTVKSNASAFTGVIVGAQGSNEIKDGKIDGDKLTWSMAITQPMPITITFAGEVSGDSIKGDVKFGSFGGGTFSGARA